jgi:nitronate monooxygenase
VSNQTLMDAASGQSTEDRTAAYAAAVAKGDAERIVTWAGTSVGAVRRVAAAEEVVQQIRVELAEVLHRLRE